MNWIKINTTLPRNPKILLLGQHLGISRYEALGLAVEWLAWLDGITANGETGLSADLMDRLFYTEFLSQKNVTSVTDICDTCHTNVTKLSHALSQIGWLQVDENGIIHVLDFEKHNGETAKKRAEAAERQRKSRSAKLSQKNVTNVTKKCDQIREEKNIYNKEDTYRVNTTVCGGATAEQRPCINLPQNAEEVQAFMAAQAVCGLRDEELATCAMAFFNDSEAVGWTHKGQPIRDWRAACRAFLARWQQNKSSRGAAPASSFTFRSSKKQNYDL